VKLGGVLDYKFELPRTIHPGIVAVAEWYKFRIPTQRWSVARARTERRHWNNVKACPFILLRRLSVCYCNCLRATPVFSTTNTNLSLLAVA